MHIIGAEEEQITAARTEQHGDEEEDTGIRPKTMKNVSMHCFFASFSVDRVSHDDDAKLNTGGVHRRSVTDGMQGNGKGGG